MPFLQTGLRDCGSTHYTQGMPVAVGRGWRIGFHQRPALFGHQRMVCSISMAFDSSQHYKDQGSMQGSYTIMVAAWRG